jgi:hypothetical protein
VLRILAEGAGAVAGAFESDRGLFGQRAPIAETGSARVIYLIIIVLIAGAGIGRLWWMQRRNTTKLSEVEGFRASLERLSGEDAATARTSISRGRVDPTEPYDPSLDPYLQPLDGERRAAAKQRLAARRRGIIRDDARSR